MTVLQISQVHFVSFNPCSSGYCLPALARPCKGHNWYLVSILVLLDTAYRLYFLWPLPKCRMVSILVLLDTAYRLVTSFICFLGNLVSILVLLDTAYRLKPVGGWFYLWNVSILVLLDTAYRRQSLGALYLSLMSFNPCSSGYCLPAFSSSLFALLSIKFQSLFFWILPTGGCFGH